MLPLPRLGVKTWCGGVASEDARLFGCDAFAAMTDCAKLLREAVPTFCRFAWPGKRPCGVSCFVRPEKSGGSLGGTSSPEALTTLRGRDGFINV